MSDDLKSTFLSTNAYKIKRKSANLLNLFKNIRVYPFYE